MQIMVLDAAKTVCDPDRALLYWYIDSFNRGYTHCRTAEIARLKAVQLRLFIGQRDKTLHWVIVDRKQVVESGMYPAEVLA
jgi:hypothetical protein